MRQNVQPLASSFRDPSGFVFQKDGILYRQVNNIFKDDFDHFITSGCYDHLVNNGWIVSHEELKDSFPGNDHCYKTLRPSKVPFISYAFEWCFEMLKDAALFTLKLARECMPFGVMLKDATPFNVQWMNGKPIFIDTLSFARYDPAKPWIAYRQFCECFLSPLLLMHYRKQPFQPLLLAYPEGIPLSTTRSLLPWRSRFSFHTYLHIHLHQAVSVRGAHNESREGNNFSGKKLLRLLESLETLVRSLKWEEGSSTWGNYYEEANQRHDYVEQKKLIVSNWLDDLPGIRTAVDLGANDGEFSRLLAEREIQTVATDFDHAAISKLYRAGSTKNTSHILPLLVDLANPSPAIGLNNTERPSFRERVQVDVALALALIHHLAIGKNIPFQRIAEFFQTLASQLIVEFVPKNDEKVRLMLKQKPDIYSDYNEKMFLDAFEQYFSIQKSGEIGQSGRTLYQMKKHDA